MDRQTAEGRQTLPNFNRIRACVGVSGLVRWPRDHLPSVQREETDETKLKPFLQAEQGVGSDRAERLRSWAVAPAAKCEEMPGQTCLGSDHECSH